MDCIEEIAQADLRRWGADPARPTADLLDRFVSQVGLAYIHEPLGDLYGMLDLSRGTIVLNSMMADLCSCVEDLLATSVWTIAHELGHFRLHRASLGAWPPRPTLEREANFYAACLLMPREAVFWWSSLGGGIDRFCELFQVSRTSARIRLKKLGVSVKTGRGCLVGLGQ